MKQTSALLEKLVTPDVSIGIIAGARDSTVPVANTHLEGETDHVVVDTGHSLIMYDADVKRHVVEFLRQGRFTHRETGTQ